MSRGFLNPITRQGYWRRLLVAVLCLALYLAMEAWMSPLLAQGPYLLDAFDDLTPWQVGASDGVSASIRAGDGFEGQTLCLDFDFAGVAGYASAHRALALEFPPNYELSLYVRGDAPVSNLEFKLIDASGDNVWWSTAETSRFHTSGSRSRSRNGTSSSPGDPRWIVH